MSDPTHARNADNGATSAASVAIAVVLSLIVVGASFTLSFSALTDLARMSGAIPKPLTPLLPVVVDVFILQATWCVYVATRRRDDAGRHYHFAMLAIFSTVSVAGNAGHAFLATDQGVMRGLMAVAIAIVAPLALLASIHGLVMHVWTGGGPELEQTRDHDEPAAQSGTDMSVRARDALDTSASYAHSQVTAPPLHVEAQPVAGAHLIGLQEVDEQVSEDDLQLARLVCSKGRLRNDERAVARVLVAERLRVSREDAAVLTGVHRTTIGRWMELAAECRPEVVSDSERTRIGVQSTLVDAS
ncbi:DUF2637 domain-containing protein [Gordonia sp. UCD-TK1]|uniref:DUF2637 domain-containing protein n=1 Tax=Gordonia sp. UCD-TK1 TaxID=1857893 RepID=UPI00080D93D9|nr:DUF2637 domain-containing protein [Gordonia sp. UCD-TK1]OCH81446.1 hypothetical protein A9310_17300 [Gordonia sp. UCD-TK1]